MIGEERFLDYHRYTRERGVNRLVYLLFRIVLEPAFVIWFRLERIGREHARSRGGLIVASNHQSFVDPFAIGMALPWWRRARFVAKVEMFDRRWQAWILNRLGAFPIRRDRSDELAMETARRIVELGGTVIMFPEGTRVRTGLGRPRRGVGRLALETGAPVLPVAVAGSEHVRRGWLIRPRKVRVRVGRPIEVPTTDRSSPELAASVTERVWSAVEHQWESLQASGHPYPETALVDGHRHR